MIYCVIFIFKKQLGKIFWMPLIILVNFYLCQQFFAHCKFFIDYIIFNKLTTKEFFLKTQRSWETKIWINRENESMRARETERQRDVETERLRDTVTQRLRNRTTKRLTVIKIFKFYLEYKINNNHTHVLLQSPPFSICNCNYWKYYYC
jgi:hypothetical protein